jgi:hypothetical protein
MLSVFESFGAPSIAAAEVEKGADGEKQEQRNGYEEHDRPPGSHGWGDSAPPLLPDNQMR